MGRKGGRVDNMMSCRRARKSIEWLLARPEVERIDTVGKGVPKSNFGGNAKTGAVKIQGDSQIDATGETGVSALILTSDVTQKLFIKVFEGKTATTLREAVSAKFS